MPPRLPSGAPRRFKKWKKPPLPPSANPALIRSLSEGSDASYPLLDHAQQQELLAKTQNRLRDANASFDSELSMLYSEKADAPGLDDYQRLRGHSGPSPNG